MRAAQGCEQQRPADERQARVHDAHGMVVVAGFAAVLGSGQVVDEHSRGCTGSESQGKEGALPRPLESLGVQEKGAMQGNGGDHQGGGVEAHEWLAGACSSQAFPADSGDIPPAGTTGAALVKLIGLHDDEFVDITDFNIGSWVEEECRACALSRPPEDAVAEYAAAEKAAAGDVARASWQLNWNCWRKASKHSQ